jgi:hypothetical protein
VKRLERSQSALSYRHRDSDERERDRASALIVISSRSPSYLGYSEGRVTHQRRESETVMPEAAPVPARLSPSARHVPYRESGLGSSVGNTLPDRASSTPQPERPPGLSRSNSHQQSQSQSQAQAQPLSRGQHRRSPTAPEAHHAHAGAGYHAHAGGVQVNGAAAARGKTWAMGAEVVGDVDRDLGGLGPVGEVGVREKDAREMKAVPLPAPVQVNGAKNFTVRDAFFWFLCFGGAGLMRLL